MQNSFDEYGEFDDLEVSKEMKAVETNKRTFESRRYYENGKEKLIPLMRAHPKIGRNKPCICGSGKKFKKCCGPN